MFKSVGRCNSGVYAHFDSLLESLKKGPSYLCAKLDGASIMLSGHKCASSHNVVHINTCSLLFENRKIKHVKTFKSLF